MNNANSSGTQKGARPGLALHTEGGANSGKGCDEPHAVPQISFCIHFQFEGRGEGYKDWAAWICLAGSLLAGDHRDLPPPPTSCKGQGAGNPKLRKTTSWRIFRHQTEERNFPHKNVPLSPLPPVPGERVPATDSIATQHNATHQTTPQRKRGVILGSPVKSCGRGKRTP